MIMTSELATQLSTSVVRMASIVPDKAVGQGSQNNIAVQNNSRTQNNSQVERNQAVTEQESNSSQNLGVSEINDAVDHLNDFVRSIDRNLNFSVDEELEKIVVKVIDTETEKVIRQMPSEEAIAISKSIEENKSLFFDEQV